MMYILSQDKESLVNCNNIASLDIVTQYDKYQIRAYFPAVSEVDVLFCVLATFSDKTTCKNTFEKLCNKIVNHKTEYINISDFYND